jgi:flagellar basal-body rod modification protein FlgD
VDGIDLTGTEPVLLLGTTRIPLSAVQNIGAKLST